MCNYSFLAVVRPSRRSSPCLGRHLCSWTSCSLLWTFSPLLCFLLNLLFVRDLLVTLFDHRSSLLFPLIIAVSTCLAHFILSVTLVMASLSIAINVIAPLICYFNLYCNYCVRCCSVLAVNLLSVVLTSLGVSLVVPYHRWLTFYCGSLLSSPYCRCCTSNPTAMIYRCLYPSVCWSI